MRIRLHKSRTTTAIMVVSSLVVISGVAAGASETLNNLLSNSQGGIEKSVNDGNNSGTNNGQDCIKGKKDQNNTDPNVGNGNSKAVGNGNQESSDCITQGLLTQTITVNMSTSTQTSAGTVPFSVSANPASIDGLNINVTVSGNCTQNGNSVSFSTDGVCTVTATRAGNQTYEGPATDSKSFTINIRGGGGGGGGGSNTTPQTPQTQQTQTTPTPSASPLAVSRVITPRLLNLTTTYNGRSQGVNYTVDPTNANCRVTYDGSSARPTNAGTYNVAIVCRDGRLQGGATGTFIINKAPTTLNWIDPNPITTADELSKVQLNAKANVPGTYTYEEKVGQALPAGTHELNVDFTPRDTNNYLPSSADVNIDVLKYANKFAPIKVPFNLSSAGLTAKTRPIVSKLFLSEDVKEITVYGYVKPSNSKSADMKLSLARAKTVAAQIKGISPDLKINVKAMGAIINPACKAYSNKCVIVK